MPLQPLGADVIIIPIDDPDRIGSLYVPDSAKKNHDQGIVLWKGPEVVDLKAGDHVMFNAYSGDKIVVPGEGDFVVIPEEHVVAVYHPSEPDGIMTLSSVKRVLDRLTSEYHQAQKVPAYDVALAELYDRLTHLVTTEGWEF